MGPETLGGRGGEGLNSGGRTNRWTKESRSEVEEVKTKWWLEEGRGGW